MAGNLMSFNYKVNPGTTVFTLVQFAAATNQRALLHSIQIHPFGATGATAPLEFDIGVQDDVGGLGPASLGFVKNYPAWSESVQTVVNTVPAGTEPTTTTVKEVFSVHQQAGRLWIPPLGPIHIVGGTRLGFRVLTAAAFNIGFTAYLEE